MITDAIRIATISVGMILFLILFYAGMISFFEKEKRAGIRFFLISFFITIPFLWSILFASPYSVFFQAGLLTIALIAFIILVFPTRAPHTNESPDPVVQIDEQDTMFARRDLIPDSDNYKDYYHRRPERLTPDTYFRNLPGLLGQKANQYHPLAFASADASFSAVARFKPLVYGRPKQDPIDVPDKYMTRYIKQWAQKLGAVGTGVTLLKPYHLYSHKGRKETYGLPVNNKHKFAIAFLVEMDLQMIRSAPAASTVMESAQQYLHSGAIAVQVAEMIRGIGYSATAHIDGNYEVVCPLVARDAGLGEIGRMGLLMMPNLGPRVRISVVTTDQPLIPDQRKPDRTMIDFCRSCKKCAAACPANAIPLDERKKIDGTLRWQINSEACYTFWCQAGTDCSRCLVSCPYSHPDTLLHNLIRRGIRNSSVFRKFAITMENFLYGEKPIPQPLPWWLNG